MMNSNPEDSEFLARYQTLLFSDKLEKGSPNEKADVLRYAIAQLQYARLSGISNESVVSKLLAEYQDTYSNIVDSFDEKTGLNNFAEGALNLCSGHKNESQMWTSSLTIDNVLTMPCVQQLITNIKTSKDQVLPISKRKERLPSHKTNIQDKHNVPAMQRGVPKVDRQTPTNPSGSRPKLNEDTQSVMNLYESNVRGQPRQFTENQPQQFTGNQPQQFIGNQSHQLRGNQHGQLTENQPRQFKGNQENMFPGNYGNNDTNPNEGFSRMNQKPLFSNGGGRPNVQPWQNQRTHAQYGQNNDMYPPGKRKMNENIDDYDNDKPAAAGNPFRTAKQQMAIDQQKKYGGGGQQNRGAMNNGCYGTGKKSLGPRRGLNSKFVPPVINREDMEDDGNQAANTITRAVLKTGGSENAGINLEGMDEEKLKGIEPKMIELIMNEVMDSGPQLSWDDIAGLEFAKKTIKEIVVWPMLRPDIFTGLRGPPKGLLLFGPPGTGKTLIGKCIASQSKSTFFCISASSLTSKWVGEGEKMVRALFAVARAQQPAVVFIDEIDSLLTQRTDGENEASRRIKTEFLVQLDGASTSSEDRLLVIGATNRPQEIDEAARRRFVKRLYIPLPEYDARKTIILNLLKKQSYHLEETQLDMICTKTEGFSGADMSTLCREAALGPIRDMSFGDIEHISADQVRAIQFCDFEEALGSVRPSVSDKDLDLYIDWNKTFGSGGR